MSVQQMSFVVAGGSADALADALIAAGALSVEVADADAGSPDEVAWFDEPGASALRWPRCRLSALLAEEIDPRALLAGACAAVGLAPPRDVEIASVAAHDWVRLTRAQFKPIRITPRLWIVPTWEQPPDPEAINLRLDPGAAFGTGSHASTRLCLQWLAEHIRGGERVLDYGCGSGILAIAALRLGAAHACGVDIDPQALLAARDNAMQNRVAATFHPPADEPGAGYHVVLANILANPLIALAPLLAARTLLGGQIVLAGILSEQAESVAAVYAAWYEMAPPQLEDGWALLVGRREVG
ncbi:MAG: 50S ribosomal protein L11 methyltransferase [Burkholderiales bacterium]|nr:50S ribosomal protein L11 methyltransferase [Burkholderiales bacterium]